MIIDKSLLLCLFCRKFSKPPSTAGNSLFPFFVGQEILNVSTECMSSGANVKNTLGQP